MEKTKPTYINFPIEFIAGFLSDHKVCIENIVNWYLLTEQLKAADNFKEAPEQVINICKAFKINNKAAKNINVQYSRPIVTTSIKDTILLDFYRNEKPEFEKAVLLAHLSIKSVLTRNNYSKYNNLFFWSRMDGKAKSVKGRSELSFELQSWCTEYKTGKIIKELKRNWYLKYYAKHVRGFYVSHQLTYSQLVELAEKRKIKYLDSQIKEKEDRAEQEVKQRLYSKPQAPKHKPTPPEQKKHESQPVSNGLNPNGPHYNRLMEIEKQMHDILDKDCKAPGYDHEVNARKFGCLVAERSELSQENQGYI